MELPDGWEHWETWSLSEREVRNLWKLAKVAEWSAWNPHWRQYSCPNCGEPQSMGRHGQRCRLNQTLLAVYERYPQVTQPPKMDATEEIAAMEILHLYMGDIAEELRRGPDDPEPHEKGPDFSEPPIPDDPFDR